jgi:hypothetical protein
MDKKLCKKCGIEKDICEFNKDKHNKKDGLRYRCKECTKKEYRNFYYKNKESEIERQVNYQKNNKKNTNLKRNIRHSLKYKNDILYKLKLNLRNRIKHYIRSKNFNIKLNSTYSIIGCTPEDFVKYIESKFKEGMTWDNYSHSGWHIDHIIPLSNAKTKEDVIKLCNYTNLQPLWCEENYKKGDKII